MRYFLILLTAACLMSTGCSEPNPSSSAVTVEIVETGSGYQLLRAGEPYTVKGAGMGIDDIERFASHGGNSIRTWSTNRPQQDTRALLDSAHAHGVTVALGLGMVPERHGFDYDDPEAVAEQLETMRAEVLQYRDHPALLLWVIGNELNHHYTNPRVYDAVNQVAEMIDDLDPYHPTTTTTSGYKPEVNAEILARAPALDFISFQMYGTLFGLRELLAETGYDKPFMVTEWGAIGWWEMDKTDWGIAFETTSSEKADAFQRAMDDVLIPLEGQLIGSYAFFWGQKQERTPTWFGMLTEEGKETEVVDVMHRAWTGQWPDNRTPRVNALRLDGRSYPESIVLEEGQDYEAAIEVVDPEGDPVVYRWELKPESAARSEGGDFEAPIANLEGFLANPAAAATTLTVPEPGQYRLFAYAEDDHGRVAHANLPFLVESLVGLELSD